MTKYSYSNNIDKNICDRAFYYNAWLLFGKNNTKVNTFKQHFEETVKQINILPYDSNGKYITPIKPGICKTISNDNELEIEAAGTKNAPLDRYYWILHEIVHEYCHAFAHMASRIFTNYPQGKIINDVEIGRIKCENSMGLIAEKNPNTGDLIGYHYYGDMFRETMMDMITSIGLVAYESQYSKKGVTADTIFISHHDEWHVSKTGYALFTSITRLLITAFSNSGYVNYQDLINQGKSIFNVEVIMRNGENLKANDFIYGIMCDPLHIQDSFDKYLGEDAYRLFAKLLDRNFIQYKQTELLPQTFTEDLKVIMKYIANFLNVKLSDYIDKGLLTVKDKNKIVDNFNVIWNSMLSEYKTYFSQEEYDEIYRLATK